MTSPLEEFASQARSASFHYADDSAKEWGLARKCKARCEELYKNNPDLREEMVQISKGELWGNEFRRDIELATWANELNQLDADLAYATLKLKLNGEAEDVEHFQALASRLGRREDADSFLRNMWDEIRAKKLEERLNEIRA